MMNVLTDEAILFQNCSNLTSPTLVEVGFVSNLKFK